MKDNGIFFSHLFLNTLFLHFVKKTLFFGKQNFCSNLSGSSLTTDDWKFLSNGRMIAIKTNFYYELGRNSMRERLRRMDVRSSRLPVQKNEKAIWQPWQRRSLNISRQTRLREGPFTVKIAQCEFDLFFSLK
jgi:hypothetical protein